MLRGRGYKEKGINCACRVCTTHHRLGMCDYNHTHSLLAWIKQGQPHKTWLTLSFPFGMQLLIKRSLRILSFVTFIKIVPCWSLTSSIIWTSYYTSLATWEKFSLCTLSQLMQVDSLQSPTYAHSPPYEVMWMRITSISTIGQ
jgi:hypothetical protein